MYKKNHTTRVAFYAAVNDEALNLADKDVIVHLEVNGTVVTLTEGAGVGIGPDPGYGWLEVTAANLAALGDPTQVTTTINIWNADNTLALTARGVVGVEL